MIVFKKLVYCIDMIYLYDEMSCERIDPTTCLFGDDVLSNRHCCQSDLSTLYYSLIIKTSSIHFTTVHANSKKQNTANPI